MDSLPEGWLGKNHAQHFGAGRSDGEWLLFTDADIVFEPTSLRRAVWWAEQQQLEGPPSKYIALLEHMRWAMQYITNVEDIAPMIRVMAAVVTTGRASAQGTNQSDERPTGVPMTLMFCVCVYCA